MSDQNDDAQNFALMVLAGVVALVVSGVIALAVATTMRNAATAAPPVEQEALGSATLPVMPAGDVVIEPEGRIYFELGSDAMPAAAAEVLGKVADAVHAQADKVVLISGYHDDSADPVPNAELAKNRALAVRNALVANGVSPDRLMMDKPIVMTGGADAREARRVELRLR
jgi:outer membrane protein OmpA-like peptidoglycan-associated protein